MKQQEGSVAVLIIALVVIAGFLLWAKLGPGMKQGTGSTTVTQLDQASTQLDEVDVDGLGNEMNQNDTDAATF